MGPEPTETRQSPGVTQTKLTPAPWASEADVLHVYQCLPLDIRKLSGMSGRYPKFATPENKTPQELDAKIHYELWQKLKQDACSPDFTLKSY